MALIAAKYIGGFDRVIGYGIDDIDKLFFSKYENILSQERGGGYWLWKPYLIRKTMAQLSEGDCLFYSDAGAYFLKNANVLIDELENSNQDIMAFELPLIEEQWSKKELFINMKCESGAYCKSNHIAASLILIKKTNKSINFVEEYLEYACNEINITDLHDTNVVQKKHYIEHRHDQSIFSLLYKKYGFRPFKDPTQYGKYPIGYSGGAEGVDIEEAGKLYLLKNGRMFRFFQYKEPYEMVLFHNRKAGIIISLIKFFFKEALYKTGISNSLVR
ncbi:MAG: hypothetical protein RQ866_00605 [Bacteroidales bacterium]|nr:hypothetical protein [Bacteroidales bacterium]